MILSCNSCEKKFVVPDNAIGPNGRLVQCSSCGNQWKQFPIDKKIITKEKAIEVKSTPKKAKNYTKKTKKKIRKKNGPDLYSPEYLAKKHGIKIDSNPPVKSKIIKDKTKVSFGFYYSFIVSIIIAIFLLRLLYFTQDIIIEKLPLSEVYINYLFESINNMIDIIQNLFSNY